MRLKKYLHLLCYLVLILVCAGVVYLLGELGGSHSGTGKETEHSAQTPEESTGGTGAGEISQPETDESSDRFSDGSEDSETENGEAGQEESYEAWISDVLKRNPQKGSIGGKKRGAGKKNDRSDDSETKNENSEEYVPPTIMIVSDLHYMSGTMHDDGTAFWKMVADDDGKTSQYSDFLMDALADTVLEKKPSALVLTGDITLNGERENHEKLAKRLRAIQDAGVPVVVIPGNHDISNKNSATYFGKEKEEAEYLHSGEEFYEIYHEFGFDQSPNRDPSSLSYVYPVDAGHWLLMLDSCQYENGNKVGGRIRPETLTWLGVHLRVAQEHGIEVLPMAHHNLLSESRMYTSECTLENTYDTVNLLESYHVPLYISGHLHAERIKKHKPEPGTSADNYGVSEIVMPPFSIPACQYGILSWDTEGGMHFETEKLDVEAYAKKVGSTDEHLLNFSTWSSGFVKEIIKNQVMKTITLVPDDLKAEMAGLYADLYYDYCCGNKMSWEPVRATAGYKLWQRVLPDNVYTKRIAQMIEDVRDDLHTWDSPASQ